MSCQCSGGAELGATPKPVITRDLHHSLLAIAVSSAQRLPSALGSRTQEKSQVTNARSAFRETSPTPSMGASHVVSHGNVSITTSGGDTVQVQ